MIMGHTAVLASDVFVICVPSGLRCADSRPGTAAQHIRDITDPEHPYSLEELRVVSEDLITVSDGASRVRCAMGLGFRL